MMPVNWGEDSFPLHLVVKGSMAIATPKFGGEFVRGYDQPRLVGVAPPTFQVVYVPYLGFSGV